MTTRNGHINPCKNHGTDSPMPSLVRETETNKSKIICKPCGQCVWGENIPSIVPFWNKMQEAA